MTDIEEGALIDGVILREGRTYTYYPEEGDPPTKYGITARDLGAWRSLGRDATPEEVQAMEEPEARQIYRQRYIYGPRFDQLADPRVREFTIDWGINSGVETAALYLQRAVGVEADGHVGPVTLMATNGFHDPDPDELLERLVVARVEFLVDWIRRHPKKVKFIAVITRAVGFLKG